MTAVPQANANQPTEKDQGNDPKFDDALAKAQAQMPTPDQLAQMGVAVMAPIFMSHVQEIIGEALSDE
jgi:hypothetical protein